MLNGGYIIVSVADTNIYEKVNNALINGKPILFYDDTETAYYIDTISKDADNNIILTKGGKTFTITDVNSVMATGEVVNHLYKLQIEFQFKIDADENECIFDITMNYNKSTMNFDEFLQNVLVGDLLYNFDADVVCEINSFNLNGDIMIRYFNGSTWAEYDNYLNQTTLSLFRVKSYKQLF